MRRRPQSNQSGRALNPAFAISRVRASRTARTETTRPVWAQLGRRIFEEACARPERPRAMTAIDRRRKLAHPPFLMGRPMKVIPFLFTCNSLGDVLATAGLRSDAAEARVVARHGEGPMRMLAAREHSRPRVWRLRRLRWQRAGAPHRGRLRRPSEPRFSTLPRLAGPAMARPSEQGRPCRPASAPGNGSTSRAASRGKRFSMSLAELLGRARGERGRQAAQ